MNRLPGTGPTAGHCDWSSSGAGVHLFSVLTPPPFAPASVFSMSSAVNRFCVHVVRFATLLLATWPAVSSADVERQHVLVAVGAEGSDEYGSMFRTWAERWKAAAASANAEIRIIGLDHQPADKPELTQALTEWSAISSAEPLWSVLIGHGTFDGRTARFNLRGPDITAVETAQLLEESRRPLALISCTSCSAPFINTMSGPDRVIITATKDGGQFQLSRLGDAMAEAVAGMEADLDRDGQVSLLEAWAFAVRRTDEYYSSRGQLATEHALLDDNGDRRGSRLSAFDGVQLKTDAGISNPDGRLARRWHLVRSSEERRLTPNQRQRRDQLEIQLEQLQQQRDNYTEADYLDQLQAVLLPLARLYAESEDPPQFTEEPAAEP